MKDTSYHDFVLYDLMLNIPDITSKPMMSGWCIYSEKIPIGAIIDDQLYFKVDGELADKLKSLGSEQFEYEKSGGKIIKMKYHSVPDELIDSPEDFENLVYDVIEYNYKNK